MQISQEPEEKGVQIQGLQMNYRIKGEGKPLLILHGWGGSSDSWIYVLKILAGQGLKVIVPDFPGFGKSEAPKEPWRIDNFVQFFSDFIEKMEIKIPFFLLGHSFGGTIATKFAVRHPQKISRLILIAPPIIRQRKFKQYIYLIVGKIGKFIFSLPILSLLKNLARKSFYKILGIKDYYTLYLQKKPPQMKETFKNIIREDLQKFLPLIKNKTLLIWGEKDKIISLEDARIIKEKIQDSELKIIEGANHLPHFEKPEKLTEVIIKFLKS